MQYRIGEFARHMGVSPDILKHCESLGRLSFTRASNGYRYCDFAEVARVVRAKSQVMLGLPLRHVDETLDDGVSGGPLVDRRR